MVLTALGKKYRHIQGYVHALRKDLEAHVRKVHGKLSPTLVAEVNLACRYETTAAITLYQVSHGDSLPAAEVQSLLKTATWATQERNRCIGRLGLNSKAANAADDPWAILDQSRLEAQRPRHSVPEGEGDSQEAEGAGNASSDATRNQEGQP